MNNLKFAALSSIGVLIYVAIVSAIMNNAETLFGKADTVLSGMGFLLLFALSAGVVGSLIVGKPIFLYLDGKKKEAVSLLIMTLCFIAVLTIAVLLILGVKS
jgi:hypothetical protein